jgi:hypothetical protein
MAKTVKAVCQQCRRETNHEILHDIRKHFTDEKEGLWATYNYQVIECSGCEEVSFREVSVDSESYNSGGELEESVRLFPIRSENTIVAKPFYNVPFEVRNIYRETIDAFNNGLFILCSGGLRAILEGICNSEGITDGPVEINVGGTQITKRKKDLQGKIGGLFEKGLLTKKHTEFLHDHRFIGNDALHTLQAPSGAELKLAIEILEHTLENLYELTDKVENLRYRKGVRAKKAKK